MADNVVKLRMTDTDECEEFAEGFKTLITNQKIVSSVYVALDKDGEAYYGKSLNLADRLAVLGAIDLLRQNIINTFELEEYG